MFSGYNILLSGFAQARVKTFADLISKHGGNIVPRVKTAKLFRPPKTPIEDNVTHIVVPGVVTMRDLCEQLNCSEVPRHVPVVQASWLENCFKEKRLLPLEDHAVDFSASTAESCPLEEQPSKRTKVPGGQPAPSRPIITAVPPYTLNTWHTLPDDTSTPSILYKFAYDRTYATAMHAFDMDGTLITTKSGAKFAENSTDWKFLFPNVVSTLQDAYSNGAYIAVLSNQSGVSKGHVNIVELKQKIDAICNEVGVPIDIICAFEDDIYRKPRRGGWDILHTRFMSFSQQTTNDAEMSNDSRVVCYVGDAAGRPKHNTRGKDFSASDYKLALNVGAQFHTPEAYFLKSNDSLHNNPALWDIGPSFRDMARQSAVSVTTMESQELVLLVGPPASGKSTLSRTVFSSYCRINQDALKTKAKCLSAARDALKSGHSVVVDNTNASRSLRAEWISLAKECGVETIRCIRLNTPKDVCFHLEKYRVLSPSTQKEDQRHISQVVIHSFFKYVEEPSLAEGFSRVEIVPFSPVEVTDPEQESLLFSYLR